MTEPTVYETEHFSYVRISELPATVQEVFTRWMYGQTAPLLPEAPDAVYSWDWERFKEMRRTGLEVWD
ncbi:MAG: hypothetical protein KDK05_03295 [Candidatus Competibacteraceae bacterium]|nr:hypothetical protein [Candidatus Competibacteraceae bacterium]